MKYAYTILYVENVEDTVEFYERAFGFTRKFITPENDYGELASGDTTLAFASVGLGETNLSSGFAASSKSQRPFGVELVFITDHMEADFSKALAAGATEYEKIVEKPWGQQVGYVRDNNGFLIEIATPMSTSSTE